MIISNNFYRINYIYKILYFKFRFSVQINKTHKQDFCYPTCQVILDISTNKIEVPKNNMDTINTLIGAKEYLYNRYIVSKTVLIIFCFYILTILFSMCN